MAVVTAWHKVEWNVGAGWVDISSSVIKVTGGGELTGNRENALAFGDSSESRCSVELKDSLAGAAWQRAPIRVTFKINATQTKAFAGIMVEQELGETTMTMSCVGFAELIRATRAYSRLFEMRPVATKTSVGSVEDPSAGGYAAGLMNYLFWQAGGRPLEQSASYPSAAFFYSCDQALIAPLWSWVAGDDSWEECKKLAQAAGGQVYQASDGTIQYRQPYAIADATPLYTFDETVYHDTPTRRTSARKLTTAVNCAYSERALRGLQKVVERTEPLLLHIGETTTLTLNTEWPLYSLDLATSTTPKATSFNASFPSNQGATLGSDYSVSVDWTAQRIVLTITNLANRPIIIWNMTFSGQPVQVIGNGSVVAGAGAEQRTIENNLYIQSAAHAYRLAQLYLKFYSVARAVWTLKGCVYDPNRTVGEVVNLTITRRGITAQPHLILSIQHDETGLFADYELIYVGDLGKASDYFQVGPDYTGMSKKLTY